MQQDLAITAGSVKSRQRALRMIKHVARAIADLETPTNDEIIALCTENTTRNCKSLGSSKFLSDTLTGGFLLQHWLTFAGPKWALTIISERQEVRFLDEIILYLFLTWPH